MSNISKEQVKHIAKLARIELTAKEEEKFSKELSSILVFIEKLNQVNTDKVEPILQIAGLENVVREDEPGQGDKKMVEKLLKEVPVRENNYIKVPKILE